MRVIVTDAVFDGAVPQPLLFRLLGFAYEDRHRVIVQRGPAFQRWRESLSEDAGERYDAALDTSEEVEAREPSDHEIWIGAGPVCVTIDDAIEVLERPFLVFVEDEESDRWFIEAVATPQHRDRLRRMYRRGWLSFRSQAGISRIERMIQQNLREHPDEGWRMFAVFDSDAPAANEPSRDARSARNGCERTGVAFRMLARRAIENYLTRAALDAWAKSQPSGIDELQAKIEVLYGTWFEERPERRHHFLMKKGFKEMSPRHTIYSTVPGMVEKKLKDGFGSNVAKAFATDEIREVDLRGEGAWDELSEMIEALVRRMR